VVALLRRIGVPLARIRDMLALDPASAAEQIRVYWAMTEMEHVSAYTYVTPLVGAVIGATVLNEALWAGAFAGGALVLGAVALELSRADSAQNSRKTRAGPTVGHSSGDGGRSCSCQVCWQQLSGCWAPIA
jgi:hypothetical protein